MTQQQATKLGYKMDDDYPIYTVLTKNGELVKAFLIEDFGWRFPTLHHPKILKFIEKKEKL